RPEVVAGRERVAADVGHASSEAHSSQARASREGLRANANDAVRNGDAGQPEIAAERRSADGGHRQTIDPAGNKGWAAQVGVTGDGDLPVIALVGELVVRLHAYTIEIRPRPSRVGVGVTGRARLPEEVCGH